MKVFSLEFISPLDRVLIDNIVSFTGHDESGSFNILANASKRMTILEAGLGSFKSADESLTYFALLEGVLYFENNQLQIVSSQFFLDKDYRKIHDQIESILKNQTKDILETKKSMYKLDQEIFKRMTQDNLKL